MDSGDQWDITQRQNSASPMPSKNQLSNHTVRSETIKNSVKRVDSAIRTPLANGNYQCEAAAGYLLELSKDNTTKSHAKNHSITEKDTMTNRANYFARQVSFYDNQNLYNNYDDSSVGSAAASEQTVASYGRSSVDDKSPKHEQNTSGAPVNNRKHARSLSKDFIEAYRRQRSQLAPSVIHIPRRNQSEGSGGSHGHDGSRNTRGSSYGGETQTISSLLSAGHKMPPPGYNPEARYLRATRQMPESIGINAINRPQSVELDQYEAEGSEEESEDVDDLDHFLIDPQEQPENDMWLMKWKEDDPEVCCICLGEGADERNAFVYCDNPQCEVIVHQECYGIKKLPGKDDVWLCDRCEEQKENPAAVVRCAICPNPNGAFRRLDKTHQYPGWIHVVCGTWMPNVQISEVDKIAGFDIREIPEKNWNYKCYLCPDSVSASHGACVRCDAHECKKTFHVSCAQKFSLLEEVEENEKLTDPYFTYCMDHGSHNQGEAKLNAWEKWVRQRDRYLVLKNEESAEQRCAALWKRAQSVTKSNDQATSELIRAGFGFRELVSDRYAFFAKEMADAISASQSAVFQLEAENFQLEDTISKMDSSLKDTSQKIKRAEKRKVELEKEINKVSSLVAKEQVAEKKRLELERMENPKLKKTATSERRKAELQKELFKVTEEIAREDPTRKRKLPYQRDFGQPSAKRHRETSETILAQPDDESTDLILRRSTRSRQAATFSFPPITNNLFGNLGSNSTTAVPLDVPESPSSNTPSNTAPSPTASDAQRPSPDLPSNEQGISPTTHNVTLNGLHGHANSSDIAEIPDSGSTQTQNDLPAASSTPESVPSAHGNNDSDDDVLQTAKIAIKRGQRLLQKAQLASNISKSQSEEIVIERDKPKRVMSLVETLNSVLGSPEDACETATDSASPKITANGKSTENIGNESVQQPEIGSPEINTDETDIIAASNGQKSAITPTPPHFDPLISPTNAAKKDQSNISSHYLRPSAVDSNNSRSKTQDNGAKLRESLSTPISTATKPHGRYQSFVRVSPFVPEQHVEVSVEYTPWLSKYLHVDNGDSLDGNGNDIVTEYIPVLDDDDNSVSDNQHSFSKNGEDRSVTSKRKRQERDQSSAEPLSPQVTATKQKSNAPEQEIASTSRPLSPRRGSSLTPSAGNRAINLRSDEPQYNKEQARTRSSSPMALKVQNAPRFPSHPASSLTKERNNKAAVQSHEFNPTTEPSQSAKSETDSSRKKAVDGIKETKKVDEPKVTHGPVTRAASNPAPSIVRNQPDNAQQDQKGKKKNIVRTSAMSPTDVICAECGEKEISMKLVSQFDISARDMRHLLAIRPDKKPGHTGHGKDWDPGVLVQCETCHKYYHCGCTYPPLRNYPERGVIFRCIECDEVKIIYPEVEEVLQMDRKTLKNEKTSLRQRKPINYHE